jgi:PAS domain-containing protein
MGVMAAGLLSVLALLATGSVGTRAVAALRRLEHHAEALGRGDAAAPLRGPAEVVRLARTYQDMAEHLGAVRRRFQAVFEDAPIGVVILDPVELRVRYANRTLLSFLDEPFRSAGADGRRLEELLSPAGERQLRRLRPGPHLVARLAPGGRLGRGRP